LISRRTASAAITPTTIAITVKKRLGIEPSRDLSCYEPTPRRRGAEQEGVFLVPSRRPSDPALKTRYLAADRDNHEEAPLYASVDVIVAALSHAEAPRRRARKSISDSVPASQRPSVEDTLLAARQRDDPADNVRDKPPLHPAVEGSQLL
jgi:hypothetical protein